MRTYAGIIEVDENERIVVLRARVTRRLFDVPEPDLILVVHFVFRLEDYVWHYAPEWFGGRPDAQRALLDYFEDLPEHKLLVIDAFFDRLSGEAKGSISGLHLLPPRR